MRLPLHHLPLLLLLVVVVAHAQRDVDPDENSEDVFEAPLRMESIDLVPIHLPGSDNYKEHPHHRLVPGRLVEEENEGSDGFERITAMNNEEMLERVNGTFLDEDHGEGEMEDMREEEERRRNATKLIGSVTDRRTGEAFPTLMVQLEKGDEEAKNLPVEVIEMTTGGKEEREGEEPSFESALSNGERMPIREYDNSYEDNEDGPKLNNLTAATVFHTDAPTSTEAERPSPPPSTTPPPSSSLPTHNSRPGVFVSPAEGTTTKDPQLHRHSTEAVEATDPPFGDIDPTIFSPDHLFEGGEAPPSDEDKQLHEALAAEATVSTTTLSPPSSSTTTSSPVSSSSTSPSTSPPPPSSSSSPPPSTSSPVSSSSRLTTLHEAPPFPAVGVDGDLLNEGSSPTSAPPSSSSIPLLHHLQRVEEKTTTVKSAEGRQRVATEGKPPRPHTVDPFDTTMHFGDSREETTTSRSSTGAPSIAHKAPFTFRLPSIDFLADFDDMDSGKFKKLRDQLVPDLRDIFDLVLGDFIAVEITGLEKGAGTVVHGMVYTRSTVMDLEGAATKLDEALMKRKNKIGGNDVDPASVSLNGITPRMAMIERVQAEYASDNSFTFIIVGVITVGVVLIILVAFVCILINNKRNAGTIKLKNDVAAAENGRMSYDHVNLMSFTHSPPPPPPPSMLPSLPPVVISRDSSSSSSRHSSGTRRIVPSTSSPPPVHFRIQRE